MLGKKKTKKADDPKDQQPEKTPTVDAKIITEDKGKLLEWLVQEFKGGYYGIFSEKDLEEIDADATSLTLLFAIFAELRLLRLLQEKQLLSPDSKK